MVEKILSEIFIDTILKYPTRIIFRKENGPGNSQTILTYGQASVLILSSLKKFEKIGLRKGDHVIWYSDDSLRCALLFVASSIYGLVPVTLTPLFSVDYLKGISKRVDAKAVFCDKEFSLPLSMHLTRLFPLEEIEKYNTKEIDSSIENLKSKSGLVNESDHAIIIPTSGSTGEPKLVVRNHKLLGRYSKIWSLGISPSSSPAQRILMPNPLNHSIGSSAIVPAIYLGAEMCIPSTIDVATPIEEIQKLDPTWIVATPRVLRSLYQQSVGKGLGGHLKVASNLGSLGANLKHLLVGGGPVDSMILQFAEANGMNVNFFYGITEISTVVMSPPQGLRENYVGKVVDGAHLKLGEDGELLAKSPIPMVKYFGDEKATREAYTSDGYFKTGDFAEISEDGFVKINGRKKDVFGTLEGSNIYPARIETMVEGIPGVDQVTLIGDSMSFISALIVIQDGPESINKDGFLDSETHSLLYDKIGKCLHQINQRLESMEKVRGFALFSKQFLPEHYAQVGNGKYRRNRKGLFDFYYHRVSVLYEKRMGEVPLGILVPGEDRRWYPYRLTSSSDRKKVA